MGLPERSLQELGQQGTEWIPGIQQKDGENIQWGGGEAVGPVEAVGPAEGAWPVKGWDQWRWGQ